MRGPYINLHVLEGAIAAQQAVCHADAMRLHRVRVSIVVVADVACVRGSRQLMLDIF